jgi:hypothetical protein
MSQLHLRIDGQSFDYPLEELDLGDISTNQDVFNALAVKTGDPVAKFANLDVDRNTVTGDITVRPQAIFG